MFISPRVSCKLMILCNHALSSFGSTNHHVRFFSLLALHISVANPWPNPTPPQRHIPQPCFPTWPQCERRTVRPSDPAPTPPPCTLPCAIPLPAPPLRPSQIGRLVPRTGPVEIPVFPRSTKPRTIPRSAHIPPRPPVSRRLPRPDKEMRAGGGGVTPARRSH